MALLNAADALRVGTSTVDKVYAGSTQVWPTGSGEPLTYPDEVMADSPLIYYRLGSDLLDSSGHARHGVGAATPTPTTGLLTGDTDGAMSFNGTTQGVACTVSDAPINTPTFTVEAVIKPTSVSGAPYIASRQNNFTAQDSWVLQMTATTLAFTVWNNGGLSAQTLTATTTFSTGVTYHVAAVHGGFGGRLKLYVNGVEVADAAAVGPPYYGDPAPIRLARWAGGGFYAGVIDEFAYYGTALAGTRIAAHYAAATA